MTADCIRIRGARQNNLKGLGLDLPPEGGDRGGRIVAQGPPGRLLEEQVDSYTVKALGEMMSARGVGKWLGRSTCKD